MVLVNLFHIVSAFLNNEPVVFIHGVAGWGDGELGKFKYWGGTYDMLGHLRDKGYHICEVSVGPFSSSWDRAAEIYAQIKGGVVDYGLSHSVESGHHRFGREYVGCFPEWSETRKVHLIGHSMGGLDARLLTHTLNIGQEGQEGDMYAGNKDWIRSVTTINTPHNGSPVPDLLAQTDMVQELLAGLIGVAGILVDQSFYDFKLDQFEFSRQGGERIMSSYKRLIDSGFLEKGDNALETLTVDGTIQLNKMVRALPHVYYLSHTSEKTYEVAFNNHYPEPLMWFFLWPSSIYIGKIQDGAHGVDKEWRQNDGLVSLKSQLGPQLMSNDVIVEILNGDPIPGVWVRRNHLESWDHLEVVGIGVLDASKKIESIMEDILLIERIGSVKSMSGCPSNSFSKPFHVKGSLPTSSVARNRQNSSLMNESSFCQGLH